MPHCTTLEGVIVREELDDLILKLLLMKECMMDVTVFVGHLLLDYRVRAVRPLLEELRVEPTILEVSVRRGVIPLTALYHPE